MTKIDQAFDDRLLPADRIPVAAYVLTACIGVIGSNSLVLSPIAPEVSKSLGATVPGVMMASAVFGLGTAASALFLARHIDRLGASRMLRLAMALLGAALLVSALSPVVAILIAAQLAAGLASGIALPAIYASAATVATPGREARTIGIVLIGWTLSMVAGVSLSAVLADTLHWRAVYAAVAALAAVAVVMLSFIPIRDNPASGPAPVPLTALRLPGVKPLLVASTCFMAGFYGVYGYLGDHVHHGLGQPVSANGLVALIYGIGFGGSALLDGTADRIGARRLLPIAFVAVAAVFLFLGLFSQGFVAVVVFVGLWGLANHFGLNLLIMRLTAIDPSSRGTIMGLNSSVTYLAVFAGTTGFGPVYTSYGFAACAGLALVLKLVAAALAWLTPET